jgi:hypothetical protein
MRNSKKNITKRRQTKSNKKTAKKGSKKSSKCVYTDEAKRIMQLIKLVKKNSTNKKR